MSIDALRAQLRLEIDLRRREALGFAPVRPRPARRLTKKAKREHREETIDAAVAVDFARFRRIRLACCEHVGPTTDLDLHAAEIVLTLAGMSPTGPDASREGAKEVAA